MSSYNFPSTPASHGSGLTPEVTHTGFTTDPQGSEVAIAHLIYPFDTPSEQAALSLTSQVESPAFAATSHLLESKTRTSKPGIEVERSKRWSSRGKSLE